MRVGRRCLLRPWVFFPGSWKSTSPYHEESFTSCVFVGRESVWRGCFECDWSLMCGCTGLKNDCLNKRVQAHTFIQTPGEAESVECAGMPFLDRSPLLLLTGELCSLHSGHNTWFTLSHQRKGMHAFCYTHTPVSSQSHTTVVFFLSNVSKWWSMSEIKLRQSSPVHSNMCLQVKQETDTGSYGHTPGWTPVHR